MKEQQKTKAVEKLMLWEYKGRFHQQMYAQPIWGNTFAELTSAGTKNTISKPINPVYPGT
jgi:hypothetical protein